MTRLLLLPLLLPAVLCAQEKRGYSNVSAMVGTDLFIEKMEKGEVRSYTKGRYKTVNGKVEVEATGEVVKEWTAKGYRATLSLQPGSDWHTGKAWIVREDEVSKNQDGKKVILSRTYLAFRGHYQFFSTKDRDTLTLRLGMPHAYKGTVGKDGIDWVKVKREAVGMDFEFTAADGVLPTKPTLTAKRAIFVDPDDGTKSVLKYHEPDGIVEKLTGSTELRKAKCDFMDLGASVKLSPKTVDKKTDSWADDLPPGIVLRKK